MVSFFVKYCLCHLNKVDYILCMSYKGKFRPKNYKKYKGDPTNIVYRSLWELKFMRYCDSSKNIVSWCSEEVVIPYMSPTDRRVHRYFPDFYIKVKESTGKVVEKIIEIKPKKQCVLPKNKKNLTEVVTYAINQAKWSAAKDFCADRKWQFQVLTEKELGI